MPVYQAYNFDREFNQYESIVGAEVYTDQTDPVDLDPTANGVTKTVCTLYLQIENGAGVTLTESTADKGIVVNGGELIIENAKNEAGKYRLIPNGLTSFRVVYIQREGGKYPDVGEPT